MLRTLLPPPGPALLRPSHGARGCRSWSWHRAGWSCRRRPARPAGPSPRGTVWPGRLQGKGQRRDAGFAEMEQGHTNLPPPGSACLRWVSCCLDPHFNTLECVPGRENHPCALPSQALLTGIQTRVRLCPFLGEEAGLDGPRAPTGQSCRMCLEPFPTPLFPQNFLQFS